MSLSKSASLLACTIGNSIGRQIDSGCGDEHDAVLELLRVATEGSQEEKQALLLEIANRVAGQMAGQEAADYLEYRRNVSHYVGEQDDLHPEAKL